MQRLWQTLLAKTMQHLKEGCKNTHGLYYLLVECKECRLDWRIVSLRKKRKVDTASAEANLS